MRNRTLLLLLFAIAPLQALADAADAVVIQVVERDFDRDGVADRATLLKRGDRRFLRLQHGSVAAPDGVTELRLHPRTFENPKLAYVESARYLTLGDPGARRKVWVLWYRGQWVMVADSRSGIDTGIR